MDSQRLRSRWTFELSYELSVSEYTLYAFLSCASQRFREYRALSVIFHCNSSRTCTRFPTCTSKQRERVNKGLSVRIPSPYLVPANCTSYSTHHIDGNIILDTHTRHVRIINQRPRHPIPHS